MPYLPKYEFDIFVSYADSDGREWIDHYCEQLLAELRSLLPRRDKPQLFLDKHDLRAGDVVDRVVRDGHRSALFLAFISPQYMASLPCMRDELQGFQELHRAASDRIFQIIRVPIQGEPPVAELLWVQAEERRLLLESLAARLISLRHELVQLYVAWPGRSGDSDRQRIEAELKAQRFVVHPNIAFNKHQREEDVRKELGESDLSIHIFLNEDDPFADLQFCLAKAIQKPALVVTRNIEESRKNHLDTSPPIFLADSNAMAHLIARVNQHLGLRREMLKNEGQQKPFVLLFNPDRDWRNADDLTQLIRAKRADVIPPCDPCPGPFLHLGDHQADVRLSSGVVICWGNAWDKRHEGWDRKLSVFQMHDKDVSQLAKVKCIAEPPPKERSAGRGEFIVGRDEDLPAFLQAAGAAGQGA